MNRRFLFAMSASVAAVLCACLLSAQEPATDTKRLEELNIYFLDRAKGEPDALIAQLSEAAQTEQPAELKAETAAKLGWLHLLYRSDSKTALQWFSQAIELDKKKLMALEGALICDMALGNHDGLAQRTCDIIEADPDSHVATLYLRVLHGAMYITDSWNAWPLSKRIAFLEGFLARKPQNPTNESLAKSYLIAPNYALRRRDEAFQLWKSLGCVDRWLVLGYFCPEGTYGFYEKLPPELETQRASMTAKYTVDYDELRWVPVTITKEPSYANLMRVVKNTGSCLFMATYVKSAAERAVVINVATADSYKLWLNGVLLRTSDKFADYLPIRDRVGTTLKESLNFLMLELCGPVGETSAADLSLRITDPDGRPFEDLSFQNEFEGEAPRVAPSGKELEPVALRPTAKDIFAAAVKTPGRTFGDYLGVTFLCSEDDEDEESFRLDKECYDAHKDCAVENLFMAFAYRANQFLPKEQAINQYRTLLERAVELDPAILPAFCHLGEFYQEKDPDKAIDYFRRAVTLNPTHIDSVLGLAGILATRRWEGEWLELINGLLKARPGCAKTLSALFDYYYDRLNLEKALELGERLDRLLELRYNWHKARVMARRGDCAEGIAEFLRQAADDPEDPRPCARLASIYADIGRSQDAIAMYEKAITADPYNYFHLHREIGDLWARLNDFEKAEAHWNMLLSLPLNDKRIEKGKYYDQRTADFEDFRKKGNLESSLSERFKANTDEILKNAPGVKEYPKAPSITLFLQYVVEFYGGDLKHAKHRSHRVVKILNKQGGERYGRISTGQALEECRVFTPDGRVLEADGVQEKGNLALPELDKDSVIEMRHAYVANVPYDLDNCARGVFMSPFFRFEQEPILKAQLVIITPPGVKRLAAAKCGTGVPPVMNHGQDAHATEALEAASQFFMRCRKISKDPAVEEVDGHLVYTFNFEKIDDFIKEPWMPPLDEVLANVFLFQWPFDVERVMRIRRSEHTDRRVTRNVKAKAVELTEGAQCGTGVPPVMNHGQDAHATSMDTLDKVKRIYDFVVTEIKDGSENNPSQTLIEKRGPAADLFIAMLRGIGIEADYAFVLPPLVGADDDDWDIQGPQFVARLAAVNHGEAPAAACGTGVPPVMNHGQDAHATSICKDNMLFLSVSQFSPFGALPAAAEGGRAIVLRKDGISVVHLPCRTPTALRGIHDVTVQILPDGKAACKVALVMASFESAQIRVQTQLMMGEEQRKKMFQKIASRLFPGINLSTFEIPPFNPSENLLRMQFEGTTDKFTTRRGEGWQFKVTVAPLELGKRFTAQKTREFPLRIRQAIVGFCAFDDMRVEAPDGYEIVPPSDATILSRFGYYTLAFRKATCGTGVPPVMNHEQDAHATSITIERRFLLYDQDIAPADFEKFMAFLKQIDHAERKQVRVEKR